MAADTSRLGSRKIAAGMALGASHTGMRTDKSEAGIGRMIKVRNP
jgi:hypothetical protein